LAYRPAQRGLLLGHGRRVYRAVLVAEHEVAHAGRELAFCEDVEGRAAPFVTPLVTPPTHPGSSPVLFENTDPSIRVGS
jgi:hypothetical protein